MFAFSNRTKTLLARNITVGDTNIIAASGTGQAFPSPTGTDGIIALTLVSASNSRQYEIVYCIQRNGDTFSVLRGQEGTAPFPFQSGDIISLNMTAAIYRRMPQAGYLGLFSQEVAQSPGGYHRSALVCDAETGVYWFSLTDGNSTPPGENSPTWQRLDLRNAVYRADIADLVSGVGQKPGDVKARQLFLQKDDAGQLTPCLRDEDGTLWPLQTAGDFATRTELQQAITPDWQTWQPALLFGGQNEKQVSSGRTGGYRVVGNHCDWWVTFNLIYRGASEGVVTMTGLPPPVLGGARFGVTVVSATGFNTDGRGLTAVLNGNVISFFKGQDTGEPANAITERDVEDAASVSLSGWYQIEDDN